MSGSALEHINGIEPRDFHIEQTDALLYTQTTTLHDVDAPAVGNGRVGLRNGKFTVLHLTASFSIPHIHRQISLHQIRKRLSLHRIVESKSAIAEDLQMLSAADVEVRIQRLLDVRTDAAPLLDALASLQLGRKHSGAVSAPSDVLRSNLRGGVEAASLRAIDAFIAAAEPVAAAVDALDVEAVSLEVAVQAAAQRLSAAAESASGFASAMTKLSDKRDATAARLADVAAFTESHELSSADEATLEAGPNEGDGGRAFFASLARLEAAGPRVQALLGGPAHELGMELTDAVAARTRAASEKLFAWCLEQCSQADAVVAAWDASAMATALAADEGLSKPTGTTASASSALLELASGAVAVDGGASPTRAEQRLDKRLAAGMPDAPRVLLFGLRYLSARAPALLRSCQNAALPPLRAALSRRFMQALTGSVDADSAGTGGSGGASRRGSSSSPSALPDGGRPLELSAHDPPRFCGDLLAWVHLALAEQAEALAGLFGPGASAAVAEQLHTDAQGSSAASSSVSSAAAASADASSQREPSEALADDAANAPLPLQGMLAAVSESLARPLGARLDAAALANRSTGGTGGGSGGDGGGSSGGGSSGAVAAAGASVVACFRVLDVICFYMELLSPSSSALDTAAPTAAAGAASAASASSKRRQHSVLLPRAAPLMQRLAACRETALSALRSALEAAGGAMASSRAALTSDLGGSALVASASLLLSDILRAVRGALTPASSAALPGGVDAILAALIPPVVAACRSSAEGLRRADASVYMLNCLGALHAGLSAFAEPEPLAARPDGTAAAAASNGTAASGGAAAAPVRAWVRRLADEMGAWEEDLVRQAGNDQLAGAGLLPLLTALKARKDDAAAASAAGRDAAHAAPMAQWPGLSPSDVSHAVAVFDRRVMALSTGGDAAAGSSGDATAALPRLANPAARARVRSAVLSALAAGYRRVHAEIGRPDSGYPTAVLAAGRQPSEVDALLEVQHGGR